MSIIRTVSSVMEQYGCTAEDARRYIDLRDEGYMREAAALMAGISNPPEDDERECEQAADPFEQLKGGIGLPTEAQSKRCDAAYTQYLLNLDGFRPSVADAFRAAWFEALRRETDAAYDAGYARAIKLIAEGE